MANETEAQDYSDKRIDYIDIDDALKRVRGQKAIYVKLLKSFLATKDFAALEAAIEEKDYKKASETAHSIKGITGNLSLTKLFEESAALMLKLKDDVFDAEQLDRFRDTLVKTKNYCLDVIDELEK